MRGGGGGARPPRGAGGGGGGARGGGGLDRREVQSSPRGAIVVGVEGGKLKALDSRKWPFESCIYLFQCYNVQYRGERIARRKTNSCNKYDGST